MFAEKTNEEKVKMRWVCKTGISSKSIVSLVYIQYRRKPWGPMVSDSAVAHHNIFLPHLAVTSYMSGALRICADWELGGTL